MKLYCKHCEKITKHRQKGIPKPSIVCNGCDITNMPITLVKENSHSHRATQIKFVEWNENGRAKELHDEPQIGFSCILDPQYGPSYTWLTTEIVEIVDDAILKNIRCIKFKTQNSNYTLYISKL